MCGVYSITHVASGKRYIGSTNNMSVRQTNHKWALNANRHPSCYLQRSFNKYGGWGAFEFEILCECEEDLLISEEQRFIDLHDSYQNGFNGRPIADRTTGISPSLKTRAKSSASQKGRIQPTWKRERLERQY